MKKLLIIIIIMGLVFLLGCHSRNFKRDRFMNLTEEEKQEMIQERQQTMIDTCEDKNGGDICSIESPRGSIEGLCTLRNESLLCINPDMENRK